MITLNEFVYLYRLKESKEFEYYELVPWDNRSRLIVDLPSSFRYWKSRYFFVSGDGWETLSNDFSRDVLKLLHRWEIPQLVKEHPEFKSQFVEPSPFILRTIRREEKKMTTKFNQELYARMKAKKNEPLSSNGQRRLIVVEKEKDKEVAEKGSSTPTLDEGCDASPGVSIEEVIPLAKKHNTGSKGKEKVGTSLWANAGMALAWANEVFTPEEMKKILNVPSYEMVNRHVHKLLQVLGETMHITS